MRKLKLRRVQYVRRKGASGSDWRSILGDTGAFKDLNSWTLSEGTTELEVPQKPQQKPGHNVSAADVLLYPFSHACLEYKVRHGSNPLQVHLDMPGSYLYCTC